MNLRVVSLVAALSLSAVSPCIAAPVAERGDWSKVPNGNDLLILVRNAKKICLNNKSSNFIVAYPSWYWKNPPGGTGTFEQYDDSDVIFFGINGNQRFLVGVKRDLFGGSVYAFMKCK